MRKSGVLVLFLFLLIALAGCIASGTKEPEKEQQSYTLSQRIPCKYFIRDDFMASINNTKETEDIDGTITGGVVPHHLLARNMIADFFKALSVRKPEIVIILAPNHQRIGERKINTSSRDWETYFGTLETDKEISNRLIDDGIAASNPVVLEEDHSISSLIPYVKYYMPEVRVVPVILHGNLGLADSVRFGNYISEFIKKENCAIIASVDFSHYLSVDKADEMDDITFDAIERRDMEAVSRMTNDNLDSPPSIIALLTAMNAVGAQSMSLIENNNSAKISGKSHDYTTSYFTMLFYRDSGK